MIQITTLGKLNRKTVDNKYLKSYGYFFQKGGDRKMIDRIFKTPMMVFDKPNDNPESGKASDSKTSSENNLQSGVNPLRVNYEARKKAGVPPTTDKVQSDPRVNGSASSGDKV